MKFDIILGLKTILFYFFSTNFLPTTQTNHLKHRVYACCVFWFKSYADYTNKKTAFYSGFKLG